MLGVVGGHVMVGHHQQEERHTQQVDEHSQLNVCDHDEAGLV